MKTASNELINFLSSAAANVMKVADLYTIVLKNDTTLCYTSADFIIKYDGKTFLPVGGDNPCIERSEITQEAGLSVDDLTLEINSIPSHYISGVSFIEAFRVGLFDGASFRLDFAFFKDGWSSAPAVLDKQFVGTLDVEEITGSYVKASVKSPMNRLSENFPRNTYQASCHHSLYCDGCNVNKNSYSEFLKTVGANSTKTKIYCSLNQPSGYYTNGIIQFTSGNNITEKRGIKEHNGSELILSMPLLFTPAENDTFTISAGCNKSIDMCSSKFDNLANFGGTPFVPASDSVV